MHGVRKQWRKSDHFQQAALIFGYNLSPPKTNNSLLEPSKTPTLYLHEPGLATAMVMGAKGYCTITVNLVRGYVLSLHCQVSHADCELSMLYLQIQDQWIKHTSQELPTCWCIESLHTAPNICNNSDQSYWKHHQSWTSSPIPENTISTQQRCGKTAAFLLNQRENQHLLTSGNQHTMRSNSIKLIMFIPIYLFFQLLCVYLWCLLLYSHVSVIFKSVNQSRMLEILCNPQSPIPLYLLKYSHLSTTNNNILPMRVGLMIKPYGDSWSYFWVWQYHGE